MFQSLSHHSGRIRWAFCVAAFWALIIPTAEAESFVLERYQAPAGWKLNGCYKFNVYNVRDDFGGRPPLVEFHLLATATDQWEVAKGYTSLQAAILFSSDVTEYFGNEHVCTDGKLVQKPREQVSEWAAVTVPVATSTDFFQIEAVDLQVALNKTGEYVLMFSNCGNIAGLEVSGYVQVKNPYGYLSPQDHFKQDPLSILFNLNVIAAICWAAYGCCNKAQFQEEHYYLIGIYFLSIVEIAMKLFALSSWNVTSQCQPWMSIAIAVYALKWVYSYALAVCICGGYYRVGGQERSTKVFNTYFALAAVYIIAVTLRELAMLQQESLHFSRLTVLMISSPMIMMDAAVAVHLISASKTEQEAAEKRRDAASSLVYERLNRLFIGCSLTGALALVFEVTDIMHVFTLSASMRWVPTEGVAQFVCLVALCFSMTVMRPAATERPQAYKLVRPADEGVDEEIQKAAVGSGPLGRVVRDD
mmetsp:Transcript_61283/g.145920  ORF Transcript_61283/g.145920 Transcript_61283/m.145920 type:complete len:474 (+) Transcript_61283:79-1500(+)